MAKFNAPAHLPESVQKKLHDKYNEAKKAAAVNYPDDESTQHIVATKEAHKLLAVKAPESAADIDKLEEHQVLQRGTRVIKGSEHRVCVTADGKKYSFPVVQGGGKGKDKDKDKENNKTPEKTGEGQQAAA